MYIKQMEWNVEVLYERFFFIYDLQSIFIQVTKIKHLPSKKN